LTTDKQQKDQSIHKEEQEEEINNELINKNIPHLVWQSFQSGEFKCLLCGLKF